MSNEKNEAPAETATAGEGVSDERVEAAALAICKSGAFECGEGACSFLCLGVLGEARGKCGRHFEAHGKLARAVLAAAPVASPPTSRETELETVLRPFAVLAEDYIENGLAGRDDAPMAGRIKMAQPIGPVVTFGDFRRARNALNKDPSHD